MKKYIFGIVLFFLAVWATDYAGGKVCDYIDAHVSGGQSHSRHQWYKEAEADIIVLGASRAYNHYVPSILEDSLGMSCYNCGYSALGILSMYPRFLCMSGRRVPKLVVYDINPVFDFYGNADDHLKFLSDAKRYCDTNEVMDYICEVEPVERYKLHSRLYRYNTTIFQLLRDWVYSSDKENKGFHPNYGTMNHIPDPFSVHFENATPDSVKLHYFRKLIQDSRRLGFRLVFCASPHYGANSDIDFREIRKLCAEFGLPFLYHFEDGMFVSDKNYFKDSGHMNDKGADAYTRIIAHELRQLADGAADVR